MLRGMLVLRCVLNGGVGYVVEIQRRSDASGTPVEAFAGLVFTLSRGEIQLEAWLRRLLSELPGTRGVFASLVAQSPGPAVCFRHPPSRSMSPSEAAARTAVAKLRGLLLPQS